MIKLPKTLVKEDQPEFGVVSICTCGKRFHIDKWRLQETHPAGYWVSTVHLEFAHSDSILSEDDYWYETMIKDEKTDEFLGNQWRYKTKEDAVTMHRIIYESIPDLVAERDTPKIDAMLTRIENKEIVQEIQKWI